MVLRILHVHILQIVIQNSGQWEIELKTQPVNRAQRDIMAQGLTALVSNAATNRQIRLIQVTLHPMRVHGNVMMDIIKRIISSAPSYVLLVFSTSGPAQACLFHCIPLPRLFRLSMCNTRITFVMPV